MMLSEMVTLFLDSRKRGVTGARKKCSVRTIGIYQANLRCFMTFLQTNLRNDAVIDYRNLRRLHVVQFIDWLDAKQSSKQWSKATVLQVMRSLRTFFKWVDLDEDCQLAELKGMQKYLPVMGKSCRRTDIPQLKDLKTFKNSFNTSNRWGFRDYVATCLMLDTGIRIGEVCNLRIDHAMIEEKMLIVDGKTGPRPVPITMEMARLLKAWLKRRTQCRTGKESPFMFVSKYEPCMSPNGFGQRFRKHCKKHGVPRISPHSLRHSFCTHYLRKGGDMEKLRMMTGHSNYEMLREYLHLAKIGNKAQQEELEKVSLLKEV